MPEYYPCESVGPEYGGPALPLVMDVTPIYRASSLAGIAPIYLSAVYYNESTCGRYLDHPDPYDTGPFALHERPEYHWERAHRWGKYDAMDYEQSAYIAAMILADHNAALGCWDATLSAYRKGRTWVEKNGIYWPYVNKARKYMEVGE